MRGDKKFNQWLYGSGTRITPACAGISHPLLYSRFGSWDHPRMRGDKTQKEDYREKRPGSPPHARG